MLNQSFIDLCLTLRGAIQDENQDRETAVEAAKEVINSVWDTIPMRDILTGMIAALDDEYHGSGAVDCPLSNVVYEQTRAYLVLAKHMI